jgi:hypothetical protein
MATPIKITPTLKNESSAKFNRQLEEQRSNKVPQVEKERIFSLVAQVLSKSKAQR